MARIRTIKPELFKHEELFDLERETGLPLRVAFMGLFTCCDREGRFKWRPRTLKLDVLPHDEVDFSRVLDALESRDFVRKYAFGTEVFGVIPTFHKHQVINNKESVSIIPAPTEDSYLSSTCTRGARVDDATDTPLGKDQGERKGKEGKGKEGEGKEIIVERRGAPLDHDVVPTIFAYWQKIMRSPNSKLDAKRIDLIRKAIKMGYEPRQLCEAILGCSRSAYHMGTDGKNTKKYNGLGLILRNAEYIDKFIDLANPNPTAAESLAEKNARIIAEFMADSEATDDPNVIDMEE